MVVLSSVNPSLVNQSVTFTAAITSTLPIPNGQIVTFFDGAAKIGTAPTKNGAASLTASFSIAKTHTIKAKYPGDSFHKPGLGTVMQVVNP